MFFSITCFAQESREREVFNDFFTLFKNKDFNIAYKLIHPKLRTFVQNSDSTLYTFFGTSDSIKNVRFDRFDSNTVEIKLTAFKDNYSLFRNFFLVKEKENYYFTKPWLVLTKKWKIIESEHFIFIFDSNKKNQKYGINYPTPLSIDIFEKSVRGHLNILDIPKLDKKIRVYMASSPEEVAKLAGTNGQFEGLSFPGANFCMVVFPYGVVHEVGHILLYKVTGNPILPSILKHGLEEYGDGNGGIWKNHLSTYWTKKKIDNGEIFSLNDIKSGTETTTFTKFLIEEYGRIKFRKLLESISSNNNSDIKSLIKDVFKASIKNIGEDWITWVKNYHESNKPVIRNRIEFRIIVDSFARNKMGKYTTVYYDTERELPLDSQVIKFENSYLNQKELKSHEQIELYLLNDKNRMKELFGVKNPIYIFENIIAVTTGIDSIEWGNK